MCRTPLAVRNSVISALVNGDPLSDTSDSGIPWVANRIRSLSIVVADDADFTGKTSIHFEQVDVLPSKNQALC